MFLSTRPVPFSTLKQDVPKPVPSAFTKTFCMHCQSSPFSLSRFTSMTATLCGSILAGTLGVTGCKTLVSTGIEAETQMPAAGVAYSLPTGRIEIEVVKNAAGLDAQAAAVSAQKAAASAKASADAAKQAKAATQGRTPEKSANAPVQAQASALPAIPEAAGSITATPSRPAKVSTAWSYKIRYKATRYVPDPHHQFVVSHRPNLFSNDDIRVVVGKDGLLDLVEVTSEDKSVEVVRKLIEIGKNVARIAAQAGGARSAPEEEVIFKASLDPTSDIEVAKINEALQKVEGGPYEVSLTDRSPAGSKQVNSTYASGGTAGRAFEGIVFRPALAYGLRLSRQSIVQEVATVLLPNEAEILHMPVNRSAFVKKVQKLDFNEGLLV